MPYIASLIHAAAVYRPTVDRSSTGVRQASYGDSPVEGMSAVPCRLVVGETDRIERIFGADLNAGGLVYFAGGTDIRPNDLQPDAKNDLLTITDELGNVTNWLVLNTKDPAGMHKMLVAAVKNPKPVNIP